MLFCENSPGLQKEECPFPESSSGTSPQKGEEILPGS